MKDRIRSKRGFTLLELMIVIAIMGILAAVAIPQFQKYREKRDQLLNIEIIPQEQEQINNKIENVESIKSVDESGDMNKL